MYKKIRTAPLMFPNYVNKILQDLIAKLLQRNPVRRLGTNNDVNDIKAHEWFKDLDWNKLLKKEIKPVYKPPDTSKAKKDPTKNFDQQFLNEPVVDSYAGDAKCPFPNFTYKLSPNMLDQK